MDASSRAASEPSLGFTHRYVAAALDTQPGVAALSVPTLLLLHGTGGDENDLLPLVPHLVPAPGSVNLLSPRGKVLEHGMPRFFRRLAEGVFDEEDVVRRAGELAAFVGDAAAAYGFDANCVIAVGFSNGANIAAATLLLHPGILSAAVLLHAMVPLSPPADTSLTGTPVLLGAGRRDPIATPRDTERLNALLSLHGAEVSVSWQDAGHALTRGELTAARDWLATHMDGAAASA